MSTSTNSRRNTTTSVLFIVIWISFGSIFAKLFAFLNIVLMVFAISILISKTHREKIASRLGVSSRSWMYALALLGLSIIGLYISLSRSSSGMAIEQTSVAKQYEAESTNSSRKGLTQFVLRLKVYDKSDGKPWDEDGLADPFVVLKYKSRELKIGPQKKSVYLEGKLDGDFADGDAISLAVFDDDLIDDKIGEASGVYHHVDDLWFVAGRSVAVVSASSTGRQMTEEGFSAKADELFDKDFETKVVADYQRTKQLCQKTLWNECAESATAIVENTPRRGSTIKDLEKIKAEMQALHDKTKKEIEKEIVATSKKRLASRKFVAISPVGLVSNCDELWDNKYSGKYVRWTASFFTKLLTSSSTFHYGKVPIMCRSYDESFDVEKVNELEPGQTVRIEGALENCDQSRRTITLAECILK